MDTTNNDFQDLPGRWTVFFLALAGLAVILPRLTYFNQPVIYHIDEAFFTVIGRVISEGGVYYRDVVDHKPPLLPYLLAFLFRLCGKTTIGITHALLGAVIFVEMLVIFCIGSALKKKSAGVFAALIFAVASFNQSPEAARSFQTEWLMILFSSAGGFFALNYFRTRNRWIGFLCGASYGLALFSKQSALTDFMAALIFFALLLRPKPRDAFRAFGLALSGFLAVFFMVGLYFYFRGAWSAYWYYCWEFGAVYSAVMPFSARFTQTVNTMLSSRSVLAINDLILSFPALLFIFWYMNYDKNAERGVRSRAYFFLCLWIFFSFCGVFISGTGFVYYLIEVLPPLCVAAGISFELLLDWLTSRVEGSGVPAGGIRQGLRIGLYALIGLFGFWVSATNHATHYDNAYLRSDYRQVVTYVRENSKAGDYIFVWGYAPEIYLDADRRPASRYASANYLTGVILPMPQFISSKYIAPGSWDIFMNEIRTRRPKLVVDVSAGWQDVYASRVPENFPVFWDFLKKNYRVSAVISYGPHPTFRIFQRITP